MKQSRLIILSITAILLLSSQVFAIKRVAARYSFVSFEIGSNLPQGNADYTGVGSYRIPSYDYLSLDGSDYYDGAIHFGINYGKTVNSNQQYSIGISFERVNLDESLNYYFTGGIPDFEHRKLSLYGLNFAYNYHFLSPVENSFSPYVGVGFKSGIFVNSLKGFESESEIVYAFGLNFGADIRIMEDKNDRGFLTLSSVNQYQFSGSDSRPKYLTVGGALKYYFRAF
ncbi:MAG: hypothetical protein DWP97_09360 [Calditrichaeota bacterium]|nr:MAG: hypothetical protein DWP97_09360 [Calditrichota bacterium]